MSKEANPRMLTLARESRGMSKTELADNVAGLHASNLTNMEHGKMSIPDAMLTKIADALQYPLDFFYQQTGNTPATHFFYRKRSSLSAREKSVLEARVDVLRNLYDRLLTLVDIPETRVPSVALSRNFEPEEAGLLAREFYGVPNGPVRNLVRLLEANGIAVVFLDVPNPKFDGMTVYTDTNKPIIVVNANMPNDRKRHTLAHELGHGIMHLPFRYDSDLYEKIRNEPDALENEADRFAMTFLMPLNDCRNDLYNLTYSKLSQLKLYWHVSKRSIIYRAKQYSMISESQYTNLMRELSRKEGVNEGAHIPIDEPVIFSKIYTYLREELNYTKNDLSEHVNLFEKDWMPYIFGSSRFRISLS